MEIEKTKSLVLDWELLASFELPEKAPAMKERKSVKSCSECQLQFKAFSLKKQKKNCGFCGLVFCRDCVAMKVNFPPSFNFGKPTRICERCLPTLMLSRNRRSSYSLPNLLRARGSAHSRTHELSDSSDSEMFLSDQLIDQSDDISQSANHNNVAEATEEMKELALGLFSSSGKGKISMDIKLRDYVGKALLWYSGAREGSTFDRSMISKLSARKIQREKVWKVEEIEIEVPLSYSSPSTDLYQLRLRVYYPEEPNPLRLLPVVMWYHGGAFILGDPTDSVIDKTVRSLCNRTNAVVVSVAYRLAPEFKYPTQPEDSYAALLWVSSHGEKELCVDPSRIAVGGDSAGGNLAAVVCLMAKDRNGPKLCHQLLVYPAVQGADLQTESHLTFANGPILTRSLIEWAKEQYITDENLIYHPYVSPYLAEDMSDLPPATIIAAYIDPLRDHAEQFANKLKRFGVLATYTVYKNSAHGFFYSDSQEGKEAVVEAAAHLQFYFEKSKFDKY